MTLQQAALVKVVAQVEMLFTFASSFFVFREWITWLEFIGCLLIVLGVVTLIVL
jgi:drug/metabolite transporter (DMT)-like permease